MLNKLLRKLKNKITSEQDIDKLISMGLKVGKNFHKMGHVIIDDAHCWLITIGDNVTLAPRVHLLAHDASTKKFLGYTKIGLVTIGNNVFIGANSIVLPNVTIGDNVIIGAGSVVTKDIPDNSLVVGNPAKVIGAVDKYLDKSSQLMKQRPVFDKSWTVDGNITEEKKREMINKLKNGIGFVQ